MPSAVNGQDDDVFVGYTEVHGVRKPIEDGAARFSSHKSKLHRAVYDAFDRFLQRCAELRAEPRPLTFVPVSYTHLTLPTNREV